MKATFLFFFKHYIFWILIFIFFRLIFLISVISGTEAAEVSEIIYSLAAGFRLDISTASYFAAIPFLLTLILIAADCNFVKLLIRWYYNILILAVSILSLSNIVIFRYWGTLLNSRGLAYFAQPGEMLASVTSIQLLLIVVIVTLLFISGRFFFNRFLYPAFAKINGTTLQRIVTSVMLLPLIAIGIRGGLQLIPVNESSATFSNLRILNQVAINNIWYLGHNIQQSGIKQENPYRWMKDKEAAKSVAALIKKESTGSEKIFNLSGKPNVVILLLESWTADIIEPLGGISGVTPEFTQLCNEGLLFTSVYSSGFRTDQALVSVLSGFPAQPNNSIIRFSEKTSHLPSVAHELKKNGYQTSFYYGGELAFANMNTYLRSSGFEKLTGISDFKSETRNSKWGAHDGYVLNKQLKDLQKSNQPFFSTLLTLSTHEPFEVPVETPFPGAAEPELFKKAAWYTDKCLGNYFRDAKKTSWYNNTIFILVADHGHRLPMKRDYFDPLIRRIPLLIVSPLLKPELKGTRKNPVSGQNDIAATLLAGLNLSHADFEWSNNMLDSSRINFAYISLDMAITWVQDTTFITIPLEPGLPGYNKPFPEQNPGKAYLQHLYTTFLAY